MKLICLSVTCRKFYWRAKNEQMFLSLLLDMYISLREWNGDVFRIKCILHSLARTNQNKRANNFQNLPTPTLTFQHECYIDTALLFIKQILHSAFG